MTIIPIMYSVKRKNGMMAIYTIYTQYITTYIYIYIYICIVYIYIHGLYMARKRLVLAIGSLQWSTSMVGSGISQPRWISPKWFNVVKQIITGIFYPNISDIFILYSNMVCFQSLGGSNQPCFSRLFLGVQDDAPELWVGPKKIR